MIFVGKMDILFISHNFFPESNAPAVRTYEHLRRWQFLGHNVTVVSSAPNFPDGKVYAGFKNKFFERSILNNINVIRVWTYISPNRGFIRRTLSYISFLVNSVLVSVFLKKPTVVIATSPQFFSGLAGMLISMIRKVPFVFEVRDLWPDSIEAVGAMEKRSLVFKALKKLEFIMYSRADLIVCVTSSFKQYMIENNVPPQKIHIVTNGVDFENFQQLIGSHLHDSVAAFDDNDFVVGYVGTVGMSHELETIIEAAAILRKYVSIKFLIVGSGAELERLIRYADKLRAYNVEFVGKVDRKYIPGILNRCNVCIVSLKNTPLFKTVIPSKIFECFAAGAPVLMMTPEGEATDIVLSYGAGIHVKSMSAYELSDTIISLSKDPLRLGRLSNRAKFASSNFSRQHLADDMLRVVKAIVKS